MIYMGDQTDKKEEDNRQVWEFCNNDDKVLVVETKSNLLKELQTDDLIVTTNSQP